MFKILLGTLLFLLPTYAIAQNRPFQSQGNIPLQEVMDKTFSLGLTTGGNLQQEIDRRDQLWDEKLKWVLDNWVPKTRK